MTAINSQLYRPGSLGSGVNLDGFHPCQFRCCWATPKDYALGQTAAHPPTLHGTTRLLNSESDKRSALKSV
jgi:hypothetical protein